MKTIFAYRTNDFQLSIEKSFRKATSCFLQNDLLKCLTIIEHIASIEYNINRDYCEPRLMNLIYKVANKLATDAKAYTPITNHVVFYDCLAHDNKGLTQQYIEALGRITGIELLYIHENCMPADSKSIVAQLNSLGIAIKELGDGNYIEKCKNIKDIIEEFRPATIFFHLEPNTPLPFLAFSQYKSITKYQINLTDHAFWLGDAHFFNFIFEFRDYGACVSVEKRGFNEKQIFKLPFYPWIQSEPFKGFPLICNNKKILFSGGSLYKIEGAANTFMDIVKSILLHNDDIIFLYAGSGNLHYLKTYVENNSLQDKVLYIGNRTDIVDVFKNIDVYLDTYPFNGGLMCQLAAMNGKPILAYKSKDAEEVVCTRRTGNFVREKVSELLSEATRLFTDDEYYKEQSLFFKSLIARKEDFDNTFEEFYNNRTHSVIKHLEIDYIEFTQQYINRINEGTLGRDIELMFLRISPSTLSVKMWLNLITSLPVILRKMFNYICIKH